MMSFKRIAAAILSSAVCLGASAAVGAVGTDELSITASNVGAYEVQIDLKNTSDYYLANVEINVSGAGSTGVKSYGVSGADDNEVRSVAPGQSISAYANIDPSTVTQATTKTPSKTTATQPKPSQTTASQNGNPGVTTTKNDPAVDNNNAGGQQTPSVDDPVIDDNTPVIGGDVQTPDPDETAGTDGTEVSGTGDETEVSGTEGTEESTVIHTAHTMAPGEEVTVYTSFAGGSESEPVKVMPSKEIPPYTLWIALGAVAVLGAAAFIVIKVKKKKNAGKDITSVGKDIASAIVIAFLLTSLVAGDAANALITPVSAADLTVATAGSVSKTVELSGGKGTIVITANYTVVPAARTEVLKSPRRPSSTDECNTPAVNEKRIVEGAGPLTGHGIYVGEHDFMFYGQAISDYTGDSVMSEARYSKLVNMMNDRDSWAKQNGIKLYLVIAPNKSTVYPEYVPDKVKAAASTNADIAIARLASESTVEVIDLRQALIDSKSEYGDTLFYKYDTHWNNNGGFVGYTEIMEHVNEDFSNAYTLKKSDFTVADYETYMKDMAYYLGYYSKYTDYGPVYTLKSGMTATLTSKGEADRHGQFRFCQMWKDGYSDALKYVVYQNMYNADAPSVYMYRDSFSVSMLHFIKDSFNKSTFDWSYEFSKDEILQSGADIVIMEVVEKQLEEFVNTRTFS